MRATHFLFLLDMGLGKTKLVLDLFVARLRSQRMQMLVLVPKKVHMGTWDAQVDEHAPGLTVQSVDVDNIEAKWEVLSTSTADVVVCDYQGLGLALSKKQAKDTGGNERVKDKKRIAQVSQKYAFVAMDEAHRAKNRNTLRFSILRQLCKETAYLYALTGTPQGKSPEDLWGQFYLVDGGYTLGETLGLFRAAFFDEKNNYFGGVDYVFDKSKLGQLSALLQHVSLSYTEAECLDLPKLVPVTRKFKLTPEQRTEYNRLCKGEVIDDVRVPIDGVFIRMREVTSGYVRKRVNGVSVTQPFADNPKLELLEQDLLDMRAGAKAIIFYDYNPTGELIQGLLRRMKIKHVVLNGSTKDPVGVESKFRTDPSVTVLLSNTASGGEGINAQVASVEIFYESPTSPILRRQAIKRAHRQGVQHAVVCIDYVARGTVDERILEYVQEGIDMLAALRRGASGAQASLLAPVGRERV